MWTDLRITWKMQQVEIQFWLNIKKVTINGVNYRRVYLSSTMNPLCSLFIERMEQTIDFQRLHILGLVDKEFFNLQMWFVNAKVNSAICVVSNKWLPPQNST